MSPQTINYLKLLEQEIKAATGCTEPIAVAYAAALAKKAAGTKSVAKINVVCSGSIIKNAMGVYIPGTKERGVCMAAALGAVAGNPDKKLNVLECIPPSRIEEAKHLCHSSVSLKSDSGLPKLYVEVTVDTIDAQQGKAVIQGYHDFVICIEHNKNVVFERDPVSETESIAGDTGDIGSIYQFVNTVPTDKLDMIAKSIELNMAISKVGLHKPHGHGIGNLLMQPRQQDDIYAYAISLAAAGSDARMAGVPMPVMSNSGSGNQGICATVPVAAIAEKSAVPFETKLRACALSNLIAIHSKRSFGRLSPLCGAVAAGIGASAGITYLMNGNLVEIKAAIQNMLGSVMGMLCDGAKSGCAMKVSVCVFSAIQSALAAMSGTCVLPTEGIIEENVEKTLANIHRLSEDGMAHMDALLLQIMTHKEHYGGS